MRKILFSILIIFVFCIDIDAFTLYKRSYSNLRVSKEYNSSKNYDDIFATPSVDSKDSVFDFTYSLSEKDEKSLNNLIASYKTNSNIKLVYVVSKNTNGFESQKFLDNFVMYNYFLKDYPKYVFIFYNLSNDKIYTSIHGINISNVFNSARINMISKNMKKDYKKSKSIYNVIRNSVITCNEFYESDRNISDTSYYKDDEYYESQYYKELKKEKTKTAISIAGLSVIVSCIFIYIIFVLNRTVETKNSAYRYLKTSTFRVKKINNTLVDSQTFKSVRNILKP